MSEFIPAPKKTPMAFAAQTLAHVCDEIDNVDQIDEFLEQAFADAKLDLAEAVDRRIAFDRWVKIQVNAAEEGYRYYRAMKERLETVHARFKERTKQVIETSEMPDAFRGKLGKISLCNSPPAVEYSFGSKELTPDIAVQFGVDPHYVVTKITYSVDSARVKAELQAGQDLEWAVLKQSSHVRFPAAPKAKEIEG